MCPFLEWMLLLLWLSCLEMLWEQMERAASLSVYVPTRFSWLHVCAGCQHIDGVPRWTERPVPSLVAPRSCHLQVMLKWMLYLAYVHCVLWRKQLSNKSNSVSRKRAFWFSRQLRCATAPKCVQLILKQWVWTQVLCCKPNWLCLI